MAKPEPFHRLTDAELLRLGPAARRGYFQRLDRAIREGRTGQVVYSEKKRHQFGPRTTPDCTCPVCLGAALDEPVEIRHHYPPEVYRQQEWLAPSESLAQYISKALPLEDLPEDLQDGCTPGQICRFTGCEVSDEFLYRLQLIARASMG